MFNEDKNKKQVVKKKAEQNCELDLFEKGESLKEKRLVKIQKELLKMHKD